jgi:hypothetical protein
MGYSDDVIKRALLTAAVALPLTLGVAGTAHAQEAPYPLGALNLTADGCYTDHIVATVDNAAFESALTITISFPANPALDQVYHETTDASGNYSGSFAIPAHAGAVVNWEAAGSDPAPTIGEPTATTPFDQSGSVNRADCPGLPLTGGNAAPIGKFALGATLAGAFLVVVALRRRPRKAAA